MSKLLPPHSTIAQDVSPSPSVPPHTSDSAPRRFLMVATSTLHTHRRVTANMEGVTAGTNGTTSNSNAYPTSHHTDNDGENLNDHSSVQAAQPDSTAAAMELLCFPSLMHQKVNTTDAEMTEADRKNVATEAPSTELLISSSQHGHQHHHHRKYHNEPKLLAVTVQSQRDKAAKSAAYPSDITRRRVTDTSVLLPFTVPTPKNTLLPTSAARLRVRGCDPCAILTGTAPSSNTTNTPNSRSGVCTSTVSPLFCRSRILIKEEGNVPSTASDALVGVPAGKVPRCAAELPLLSEDGDAGCVGHKVDRATPLPFLPPRPRDASSLSFAGTRNNVLPLATSTSEGDHGKRTANVVANATSIVPSPPQTKRSASMAATRVNGLSGSANASDMLAALGTSTSNSIIVDHACVRPLLLAPSGPRGRRSRSSALASALTVTTAGLYGSAGDAKTSVHHGVSLPLDLTLLQTHSFISPSTATAGLNKLTNTEGFCVMDTNTWVTNASSAQKQSVTEVANGSGAHILRDSPAASDGTTTATPQLVDWCLPLLPLDINEDVPEHTIVADDASKDKSASSTCPCEGCSSHLRHDGVAHTTQTSADVHDECEAENKNVEHDTPVPSAHSHTASDVHSSKSMTSIPHAKIPMTVMALTTAHTPSLPPKEEETVLRPAVFMESTLSNNDTPPMKLLTVVPTPPSAGSVATPPVRHFSFSAPLPYALPPQHRCEASEFEARQCKSIHWLTTECSSLHSASGGSTRSHLLPRTNPLSDCAYHVAKGPHSTYHGTDVYGVPNLAHGQTATAATAANNAHPHSLLSASSHSSVSPCAHHWSAETSVDAMLDVYCCATTTTSHSFSSRTLESPCLTTESSLPANVWGDFTGGGGNAEHMDLTSAMFHKLSSFSGGAAPRNLMSGGGPSTSRRSSIAVVSMATTMTVSSVTCSAIHFVLPQHDECDGGDDDADVDDSKENESNEEQCAACGDEPLVDALLIDDPDAPPFAKAALRLFREQQANRKVRTSSTPTTSSTITNTTTSPRRSCANQRQQSSVTECAAVSFVLSSAEIQSCCTAHASVAEPPNCGAGHRLSTASPLPSPSTQQRQQQSAALVHIPSSHEAFKQYLRKPMMTRPCGTTSEVFISPDSNVDVVPLMATEVHLPKVTQRETRQSQKERTAGCGCYR